MAPRLGGVGLCGASLEVCSGLASARPGCSDAPSSMPDENAFTPPAAAQLPESMVRAASTMAEGRERPAFRRRRPSPFEGLGWFVSNMQRKLVGAATE